MNKSYFNSSPEEKRKQDDDIYQKFIILGIVPLFIYFMWPLLFEAKDVEVQAEIVDDRIERVEENARERLYIGESTLTPDVNTAPIITSPRSKIQNKVRPSTIKRTPVAPRQDGISKLTYNTGDEIEYIVQPQNTGWKGIVQSKQNGNYRVKITEVLLANDAQQYLTTNNACNGGKPIGKNAVNQVITVPGRCIHSK